MGRLAADRGPARRQRQSRRQSPSRAGRVGQDRVRSRSETFAAPEARPLRRRLEVRRRRSGPGAIRCRPVPERVPQRRLRARAHRIPGDPHVRDLEQGATGDPGLLPKDRPRVLPATRRDRRARGRGWRGREGTRGLALRRGRLRRGGHRWQLPRGHRLHRGGRVRAVRRRLRQPDAAAQVRVLWHRTQAGTGARHLRVAQRADHRRAAAQGEGQPQALQRRVSDRAPGVGGQRTA